MQDYFIKSIHFKNLLSFDNLDIGDFKRVNVFLGENSSGKSNIIRAIIGFTPGGTATAPERRIDFYSDAFIERPLNDSDYQDCYFEIPPFRNLVIPDGIPVSRQNWRGGIVDLKKIRESGDEFYVPLRKIIEIDDFTLSGSAMKEPPIKFDGGGFINGEQWTNCGYYTRKVDGRLLELPIDLLGWGTKSVIIIYYNLFFNPRSIVFIEEPEISTHPKLLKNLFDWAFREQPACQFFITTHSSLLIDRVFLGEIEGGVKIMRVYKENDRTRSECLEQSIEAIRTLEQLGYKSSNLLFTNYVIWVEGPSDIFYYEALLNLMSAMNGVAIRRGTHYEIMWFGGSQVKNMIDIESEDDLAILFSLGRKGGIFWDADVSLKTTNERARFLEGYKRRLEAKMNADYRFNFGCTGHFLDNGDNLTGRHGLPLTIENLMSKEYALKALGRVKHGLTQGEASLAVDKWANNKRVTDKDRRIKDKLDRLKIKIAREFLHSVTADIAKIKKGENDEVKRLFDDTTAAHSREAIKNFFKRLCIAIADANDVEKS